MKMKDFLNDLKIDKCEYAYVFVKESMILNYETALCSDLEFAKWLQNETICVDKRNNEKLATYDIYEIDVNFGLECVEKNGEIYGSFHMLDNSHFFTIHVDLLPFVKKLDEFSIKIANGVIIGDNNNEIKKVAECNDDYNVTLCDKSKLECERYNSLIHSDKSAFGTIVQNTNIKFLEENKE